MAPAKKKKNRKPKPQGVTGGLGKERGTGTGSELIMKMNLGSIVVGLLALPARASQTNIVQAKKSSKKFNFAKNQWGKKVKNKK